MKIKRFDTGAKARLITLLLAYDPDFEFEYACRGLNEIMQVYTQRRLKQRLQMLQMQNIATKQISALPRHVLPVLPTIGERVTLVYDGAGNWEVKPVA